MNRSARDAEKRQAKLEAIDQQVADGSLTIRTMTEKERRRFGIDDPERPFKRFFVPGAKPGTKRAEEAYQQLARQVRKSIGTAPTQRRIFRVEGKVGRRKARLEVGEADPASDGVVLWVSTNGDATPIYLSPTEVLDALPGAWDGVTSQAGWGTWLTARRASALRPSMLAADQRKSALGWSSVIFTVDLSGASIDLTPWRKAALTLRSIWRRKLWTMSSARTSRPLTGAMFWNLTPDRSLKT